LSSLPDGVHIEFDDRKATWLVEECLYVLIDGHHRVLALKNLHKSLWEGLPTKVRFDWMPFVSNIYAEIDLDGFNFFAFQM
jgi:hypothetical protein